MQRRSVTDSRAEVQLVQTGRYGKKEAEALVGSVTRYPPTRHSDRRIVMDAYQVMDYKEEKEELHCVTRCSEMDTTLVKFGVKNSL